MARTKTIQGAYKPFTITDTGERVKFYDYENCHTQTRNLWTDCIGQPYVLLNGMFYGLSQMVMRDGIPFTTYSCKEV